MGAAGVAAATVGSGPLSSGSRDNQEAPATTAALRATPTSARAFRGRRRKGGISRMLPGEEPGDRRAREPDEAPDEEPGEEPGERRGIAPDEGGKTLLR